jgi:glycosyltransferase involved in cell wall biosynthesis
MASPRVSALVLARDEAANLPGCVASLRWVDEVVIVVDPSSGDATERVARDLADRVLVRPFGTFADQRNAGLAAASGDWIFAVDADERSSIAQADEIRDRIGRWTCGESGFRVPIRSRILGRTFSFSGTQRDRPLRLFRRDRGRWIGHVHETVDLRGPVGELRSPLSHATIPDMRTFLGKLDRYTTLEAEQAYREGRTARLSDWTVRPLWTFAKLYVGRQGFRDGAEGFAFCALSGVSVAVRGWKLRELTRAEGSS